MMSRLVQGTLVAAMAAGSVTTAHADDADDDGASPSRSTWTVGLGSHVRWFGSRSAASLTPGKLFGPQLTVGRRLLGVPGPHGGFELGVIAHVGGGSSDGMLFQTLATHIDQLALTAGPRLEHHVWRPVYASAALEAGAARTHVTIGDDLGDMAPVDDSGWHAIGSASVGLGIKARKRRFSFDLYVELGYAVTQAVSLHARPRTHPEEDLSIATVYAELGDLDTGGLTCSTTARFGF